MGFVRCRLADGGKTVDAVDAAAVYKRHARAHTRACARDADNGTLRPLRPRQEYRAATARIFKRQICRLHAHAGRASGPSCRAAMRVIRTPCGL